MGIIGWDPMALQDLRDAAETSTILRELLDLAETELRYPPIQSDDEGFLAQYDRGFAYRRALRRAAPSRGADSTTDPSDVDADDFYFGDLYYVYRPAQGWESTQMGQRGEPVRLIVARLLHVSALAGELGH
ncbi:hypothetical protein QBC31_43015 [Streptomyces sp. B21-079]|uniref:hypothetical protein n=1 Tax=Streptomyces sp. B21-079 TaxID=3039409 RepID=UPI002FF33AF6